MTNLTPITLNPIHEDTPGPVMVFNGVVECRVYALDPDKIQQFHELYRTKILPWLNGLGITQVWGGTVGNMLFYAAGGPPWCNLAEFQGLLQTGPAQGVQMLGSPAPQPLPMPRAV